MRNDGSIGIKNHPVVSHEKWLSARTAFLAKEKEFTRLRDELSQQRRDLPWEAVSKAYVFEGPNGKQTLAELFDGRSQLIVYHFMFAPDWEAGCPSCSFWACWPPRSTCGRLAGTGGPTTTTAPLHAR